MKSVILTLACLIAACSTLYANLADSTRIKIYVDGHRTSVLDIQALQDSAKIDFLGGQPYPRASISEYGERYRTGVIYYKSTGSAPMYWLNGTINAFHDGEPIMLFKMMGDSILSVDTTRVEHGRFAFRGRQNLLTDMAILSIGNYPDPVTSLDVILEAGVIQVNMDSLTACGTPLNDQYRCYLVQCESLNAKVDALWKKDSRQAYVVGTDLYRSNAELYQLKLNTILANLSNPLGYRVFLSNHRVLEDRDLAKIDSLFPIAFKPLSIIADEWSFRKKNVESFQGQKNLIGANYKDFELLTPTGQTQKLSDILAKNNYLYLDFWASWCGPCKAEIPQLKKLYETYRSKGIEFVGISVDTTLPLWKRSLTEVDAPWLHLSDLKGIPSALTQAYFVRGIPSGFLIDKTGKIVSVCRAPELANKLKQLFPSS